MHSKLMVSYTLILFLDFIYRYRLFGSTLEIASRLNDIGKPMKIHISSETKQLLDSIGGFRIEYRGVFEIKVKYNLFVVTSNKKLYIYIYIYINETICTFLVQIPATCRNVLAS